MPSWFASIGPYTGKYPIGPGTPFDPVGDEALEESYNPMEDFLPTSAFRRILTGLGGLTIGAMKPILSTTGKTSIPTSSIAETVRAMGREVINRLRNKGTNIPITEHKYSIPTEGMASGMYNNPTPGSPFGSMDMLQGVGKKTLRHEGGHVEQELIPEMRKVPSIPRDMLEGNRVARRNFPNPDYDPVYAQRWNDPYLTHQAGKELAAEAMVLPHTPSSYGFDSYPQELIAAVQQAIAKERRIARGLMRAKDRALPE